MKKQNSKTNKVSLGGSKYEGDLKSKKQFEINKAVTQKLKNSGQNQNNLQKKVSGNYGMLSKDQIKFMKQLEKMQDHTGGRQKDSTKQIDNYLLVGSDDLHDSDDLISKTVQKSKQMATVYKNDIPTVQQKRSTTNLKIRDRDVSREKSSEAKQKRHNLGDQHKYKSSVFEPTVYNNEPNQKIAQLISHNQCASQNVEKMQNILSLEKKTTSEPLVKQMALSKARERQMELVVPGLDLNNAGFLQTDSNQIDIPDQFLQTVGLGQTMNVPTNTNSNKISLKKISKLNKGASGNQQSTQNLDLIKIQKTINDVPLNSNKVLRQIKYHKFQSIKQQSIPISQTQPQTVPDTRRIGGNRPQDEQAQQQISQGNTYQFQQISLLHQSSSQLDNLSNSQIPQQYAKPQIKNFASKIENQSLFQNSENTFSMAAQSHRNPARPSQQKLSISADKNTQKKKNNKEFLKSTMNLQQNFSHIQNNQNDSETNIIYNSKQATSKLSIERDIKFLKMSLKNDIKKQNFEKMSGTQLNTVSQQNRQQRIKSYKLDTIGEAGHNTISDTILSKESGSIRQSQEKQGGKGVNSKLSSFNKAQTLAISTNQHKMKVDNKSGQFSTKSNKIGSRKNERTDTETSEQFGQTHTKAQNYKKLILENNAKILEYQQKSCNQTPKGTQNTFTSSNNLIRPDSGTNTIQKKTNSFKEHHQNNQQQFQTQIKIPVQLKKKDISSKFSSQPVQVQTFDADIRPQKNIQNKKLKQGILKMTKAQSNQYSQDKNAANIQYFKTNNDDNFCTDVFMGAGDGSGNGSLGLISSGEQLIGQPQHKRGKINQHNQQFNSSTSNNNISNSLFGGSGFAHGTQHKTNGSGYLGVTQVGHGSIAALGQTGLGLTGITGLTTFGAANTTANTNSIMHNNKSGIQNTSNQNQRSLLNNLVETHDFTAFGSQPQASFKPKKNKQTLGTRMQKKSSMKASQEDLEF